MVQCSAPDIQAGNQWAAAAENSARSGQRSGISAERRQQLLEDVKIHKGFVQESARFLPPKAIAETVPSI
jgi:hypothetical protein